MQIKRFFVVAVVAMVAGWMLAGCQESDSRRTARKLNEATETASKLTQRSQALVANPYFLKGNQASPLPNGEALAPADVKAIRDLLRANRQADADRAMAQLADKLASQITTVSPEQLHPDAVKALERARDLLQAAITEAGDVEAPGMEGAKAAKATATVKLASIYLDLGHLHRRNFENARAQAVVQTAVVELSARQAAWESTLMTSLDVLLTPKFNPDVVSYQEALDEARKALASAQAEVRTLSAKVASLDTDRARLQGEITALSQEANEKLLTSQTLVVEDFEQSETVFEESVALQMQAIDKTREMSEMESALAELQYQLAIAEAKQAVLTSGRIPLSSASFDDEDEDEDAPAARPAVRSAAGGPVSAGTVNDAEVVVKGFTALQADVSALRDAAQKRRLESDEQSKAGLKAIGEQYRRAMELAEERAVKQFELAATTARASFALQRDPAAKALEGAALRETALIRQQQREMLSGVLRAVSMVPRASSRDVIGEANSVVVLRDWGASATDKFAESAAAFELAANELSRTQPPRGHQAWVYQANAAVSRMQQAMVTDNPQIRTEAELAAANLVATALASRENSPYLRYVRQLNAQLQARPAALRPAIPTPAADVADDDMDDE